MNPRKCRLIRKRCVADPHPARDPAARPRPRRRLHGAARAAGGAARGWSAPSSSSTSSVRSSSRAGRGIDVRPHPHIGLATVTYLFEGDIVHRDSLGFVQPIAPGDVNWMTAGRGIVHSERTDAEARKRPQRLQGIQIWVALPQRHEETAPAFAHYPAATLPLIEGEGKSRARGGRHALRPALAGRDSLRSLLRRRHSDPRRVAPARRRACRARRLPARRRHRDRRPRLRARPPAGLRPRPPAHDPRNRGPARLLLLGGEPLDGPRHLWWNFVASRQDRIEQAKEDWKKGRFAVGARRNGIHSAAGILSRFLRPWGGQGGRALRRQRPPRNEGAGGAGQPAADDDPQHDRRAAAGDARPPAATAVGEVLTAQTALHTTMIMDFPPQVRQVAPAIAGELRRHVAGDGASARAPAGCRYRRRWR